MTVIKYGIPFPDMAASIRYVEGLARLPAYLQRLKIVIDREAAERSARRAEEWEEWRSCFFLRRGEVRAAVRSGVLMYPKLDLEEWR